MKWSSIVLPGLLAVAGAAHAQDATEEAAKRQAEQLIASLHWKEGQIAVPAADAKFALGSQFRYLEASDAQKVLEDLRKEVDTLLAERDSEPEPGRGGSIGGGKRFPKR